MSAITYIDTSHLSADLSFAEKVMTILELQKRSKSWLADELGISKQAFNYLLKHSTKPKYVSEIAMALEVSPAWLRGVADNELEAPQKLLEGRRLPLKSMADFNGSEASGISSHLYVFVDGDQPLGCFAVILDNISMEPIFKKGCVLIFDADRVAKSEDFVLFKRKSNGGILFRQMIVDGSDIYFKAQDPMYQPIINEDVEMLGVLLESRIMF